MNFTDELLQGKVWGELIDIQNVHQYLNIPCEGYGPHIHGNDSQIVETDVLAVNLLLKKYLTSCVVDEESGCAVKELELRVSKHVGEFRVLVQVCVGGQNSDDVSAVHSILWEPCDVRILREDWSLIVYINHCDVEVGISK